MKTIISLLCILCMFGPANGQSGHGIIQGVVRGPSGDPIAEATVYAYDYNRIADRGARFDSTTDGQGRFVLRGLPPATYSVHAYKTADGYADTFFSFFDTGNKEAFQLVRVEGAGAKDVTLRLGPKCGVLKLAVTDWEGTPVPVSLAFFKGDDTRRMVFSTNVAAQGETLVPPVPFVVRVDSDGLESWTSDVLHPRPGESIPISLRLHPTADQRLAGCDKILRRFGR